MPGPVGDSYDPEWGTAYNAYMIREALSGVHDSVTGILGNREPLYIIDLVSQVLPTTISATFSEQEWRLIRFALERAEESI